LLLVVFFVVVVVVLDDDDDGCDNGGATIFGIVEPGGGVNFGIVEPGGGGNIPGTKDSFVFLTGFFVCSSPGKLLLRFILIVCPSLKLKSSFG